MIKLDAATVLLQWATGGLLFLWFTTRKHEMSAGYSWLIRASFLVLAAGGAAAGIATDFLPIRDISAIAVAVVSLLTIRRKNVHLDLVAPAIGFIGLIAAAVHATDGASNITVNLLRVLVGTVFLGAVSDAMLLGHWYLVQPGMPRKLINEITTAVIYMWPLEVVVLLLPTGMISVLNGSVDDGWNGVLGWFWLASAVVTGVLALVTRAALKERSYSAVMAATGLMYLAILTAFCTDIVGRALLA